DRRGFFRRDENVALGFHRVVELELVCLEHATRGGRIDTKERDPIAAVRAGHDAKAALFHRVDKILRGELVFVARASGDGDVIGKGSELARRDFAMLWN